MIEIQKHDPRFKDVKFLIKAMATKNLYKPHMEVIFADENNLVATDSKRLHIIKNDFLHADKSEMKGTYKVITNNTQTIILKKVDIMNFPPYHSIIPELTNNMASCEIEENQQNLSKIISILYNSAYENFCIDINYVKDLFDQKDFIFYTVTFTGELKPISFVSETRTAYLMPMRYTV